MSVKNHYLITGATGFVGGRFASYLKGTGRYSQISTTGRDSERSNQGNNLINHNGLLSGL